MQQKYRMQSMHIQLRISDAVKSAENGGKKWLVKNTPLITLRIG